MKIIEIYKKTYNIIKMDRQREGRKDSETREEKKRERESLIMKKTIFSLTCKVLAGDPPVEWKKSAYP